MAHPAPTPEDENKAKDEDTLSSSGSGHSTPPDKGNIANKKTVRWLYAEGERPKGRMLDGMARPKKKNKKKAKTNKNKKWWGHW